MRAPKTVSQETNYYMIITFYPNERKGKETPTVYKTITGARKKVFEILKSAPLNTEIMIRQETVYYRDPENELSTNSCIESITKMHNAL